MKKVISPGEINVGQKVTVLDWKPKTFEGNVMGDVVTAIMQDNLFKGDVLEIIAVELPYIVVKLLNGQSVETARIMKTHLRPFQIDTRGVELMEISDSYAKALIGS